MHSRLTTSIDQEYLGYLPIPLIGEVEQKELIEKVHELKRFVGEKIEGKMLVKEIENSKEYLAINSELNKLVYSYYGLNVYEISTIETRLNEFYLK
jgi:hypothetical protein